MKKHVLSGTRGRVVFWAGLLLWLAFFVEHLDVWQGHEILSLDYLSRFHDPRDLETRDIVFVSIDSDDFQTFSKGESHLPPETVMETIARIACAEPLVIAVALDTTNPKYHALEGWLEHPCGTAQQKPRVPIVWARQAWLKGEPPGSNTAFKPNDLIVPGVVLGGAEEPPEPSVVGISNLFLDGGAVRRYKWVFATEDGGYADSLALAVLKIIRKTPSSQTPSVLEQDCQILNRDSKDCLTPAFIVFSQSAPHRVFTFQTLAPLSTPSPVSTQGNRPILDPSWKDWLKGKIVFVGGEYPQGSDRYPTPVGEQYGVRIHAEALASQWAKNTIWVRPGWVVIPSEIAALCILFFLQHWIKKPAARLWTIFLGMLALSTALSYIAFDTRVVLSTWLASLNFIPLLAAVFLDVVKDFAAERMSAS